MDLREAQAWGYDAGVRHPWETARIDVVRALIRRTIPLEPHASVIDVGCGDTFVVEQLSADRPDARFFAVDTAFTPELIARYRERVANPSILPLPALEDVPLAGDQPASLVLLMDVIEHIRDDRAFLSELVERSWVGPDTRFLITVPAYQSLFCSHDTFLGHHRRYSNAQLRASAESAGLMVLDIGYFFFSLLPIRVLQVLKERLGGGEPEQPSSGLVGWQGGASRAAFLHRLLLLDAAVAMRLRALGIRLTGLSNYAICAKSA